MLTKTLVSILPILSWLLLFLGISHVPEKTRPNINVTLLPYLDALLFNNSFGLLAITICIAFISRKSAYSLHFVVIPLLLKSLSDLSAYINILYDVISWISYGILHYISIIIFSMILLFSRGHDALCTFLLSFGSMNTLAVLVQIIFPCAPPWYNDSYGNQTASYDTLGNAAGLNRIDKLLDLHFYEDAFKHSPLVFGAMPSLHSGFATIITMFTGHYFGKKKAFMMSLYIVWQWFAALYLRHHYIVDLLAGSGFAIISFFFWRKKRSFVYTPLIATVVK